MVDVPVNAVAHCIAEQPEHALPAAAAAEVRVPQPTGDRRRPWPIDTAVGSEYPLPSPPMERRTVTFLARWQCVTSIGAHGGRVVPGEVSPQYLPWP